MALYYDLQFYKDVYSLTLLLFQYTKEYPREYKHNLGEDIRRDSIELVRSIYRANRAKDKTTDLDAFLEAFEVLKFEVRLSMDLKILSVKHYTEVCVLMDSIGRQINAWRRSSAMPESVPSRRGGERRGLDESRGRSRER